MNSLAIILILASLIPLSYCIRQPQTSLTFPLYHKSHPKIQSKFDESKAIANFTGDLKDHLYYVDVFFGTQPVPLIFVFDTGSMLTWINISRGYDPFTYSTTCARVSNTNHSCQDVPGNNYDKDGSYLKNCQFQFTYGGGTSSKGDIAYDKFYLFEADGVHPVEFDMIFGGATEGDADKPGVMGVSTHSTGLMTALKVKHMSMCFPKDIKKTSRVRFGRDSIISGGSTPLNPSEIYKWAFNVDSIGVEGSNPSQAGTILGGTFIFDTGSPMSYLKSDIMDTFELLVEDNVKAARVPSYSGYELCFDSSVRNENLIISLEVAGGGGTLDFQSDSLWVPFLFDSCLAIKRSPASINKNIFGAMQMAGWTLGVDVTVNEFYFDIADC